MSGTIKAISLTIIPNLKRSNGFIQIIVGFDDLLCFLFQPLLLWWMPGFADLRSFCNLFIIRLTDLKLTYKKTICNSVNAFLNLFFLIKFSIHYCVTFKKRYPIYVYMHIIDYVPFKLEGICWVGVNSIICISLNFNWLAIKQIDLWKYNPYCSLFVKKIWKRSHCQHLQNKTICLAFEQVIAFLCQNSHVIMIYKIL